MLALYLRQKVINLEKALQLQEKAELIMAHNEFDISSSQVLALVDESTCSSYDCEFIALAHQLNIFLVTQDKKSLIAFPSTAISVIDYLSTFSLKP